ncbi:MAG: membrane protein insertase YidC [Acidobacteria bacterium]|nr:membrane protein insertase YidC [Acidobacteriota bacterium]
MEAFFKAFASVLAFFYDITGNYALAIIALTLLVMIIVTPLTLKGTRSMMMMQQLQPEMKKIQTRYKDDRQKLNEELLKFYKENNINPLGGCLPLLVQMPVFLVLYQVLRGLTRRVSDLGADVGWVSGHVSLGGPPSKAPSFERVFDPAWISQSTKMYENLSVSYQMKAFGLDLAESASQALKSGILHALPFLVLIVIVAITGFVQQRQIQGRNPAAQSNPQQQMIMKIMPFFLPVISFGLPSGLVLYFAVSNIYRIGQQAFISHSIYGMKEGGSSWKQMFGFGALPSAPKTGSAKSGTSKSGAGKSGGGKASTTKTGSKDRKPSGRTTPSTTKAAPAAATKGARPASARTSAKERNQSDRSATPASAPTDPSGSDAASAPPPLQPRARKKKD